jgi:hypothetical protein
MTILTNKPLDRERLTKIAGGDFKSLKYLEDLFRDAQALLDGIQQAQATADSAQADALQAIQDAVQSHSQALMAKSLAIQALEEANMQQSALIYRLWSRINVLEARINSLEVS